jgi:hypothetical protein
MAHAISAAFAVGLGMSPAPAVATSVPERVIRLHDCTEMGARRR